MRDMPLKLFSESNILPRQYLSIEDQTDGKHMS